MKAYLVAGYVFFFSLSVLAGYWLGQQFEPQQTPINWTDPASIQPGAMEASQLNLLVVSVKQLRAPRPELQVIWMVAFNPETPIKLVPIYPSNTEDPAYDKELSKAFGLKRSGGEFNLNKTTIQKLQDRELDWGGVIVLDNRALAYFIDAFGPIQVGEENISRDLLEKFQFPGFETGTDSLTYNTLLWREICWNILHSPQDIVNLNSQFRKHASAIFSDEIAGQDWISLLSNVKIPSCEFPMYFQANP